MYFKKKTVKRERSIKDDDYGLSLIGKKQGRVKKERQQAHEIDIELREMIAY